MTKCTHKVTNDARIKAKQAEYDAVKQEERAIHERKEARQRELVRINESIEVTAKNVDYYRMVLHSEPQYHCPSCSIGLVMEGDVDAGNDVLTVWPKPTKYELARAQEQYDSQRKILKDAMTQRALVEIEIDAYITQWGIVNKELIRIGQEIYSMGTGTGGKEHDH